MSKKKEAVLAAEKSYLYDILHCPVVTEKSTMASEFNKIVFKVPLAANKPVIKKAVEEIYNVKVESINTLRRKGKQKRFKGRLGFQKDYKKAIVTLKEGDSIDIATTI